MKYIYIIVVLISSTTLIAQDYFSKILPTTDNPLVKVLKKIDNSYLIPTDFFSTDGVKGGFLILDESGEVRSRKYENMDLCAGPLLSKDGALYLLGENPFRQGDSTFFVTKLDDPAGDQIWFEEYDVSSPKHNPRNILGIEDKIYVINVELESNESNYPQEISLYIFDEDGIKLGVKRFNTNKRVSFARQSFVASDKSIIISSLINEVDSGPNGPYSQVMKISKEGEVLWNYEGNEELENGAVPTWATELSDGSFLQSYYVNRKHDVDFILNEWYPTPNKFLWLSEDGIVIREKTIITDITKRIIYNGIKAGHGDYFYAYGLIRYLNSSMGIDNYSCHLTKFSNAGDTLWTHNYQYPQYIGNDNIHNIKDIIEEENGDITVLANISPVLSKNEVWLFRLNSEGCYINEDCEDMSDLTSTTLVAKPSIALYPNPTSGWVHIDVATVIKEIRIVDMDGRQVDRKILDGSSADIDMSGYLDGVYLLHIVNEEGKVETRRLIKI